MLRCQQDMLWVLVSKGHRTLHPREPPNPQAHSHTHTIQSHIHLGRLLTSVYSLNPPNSPWVYKDSFNITSPFVTHPGTGMDHPHLPPPYHTQITPSNTQPHPQGYSCAHNPMYNQSQTWDDPQTRQPMSPSLSVTTFTATLSFHPESTLMVSALAQFTAKSSSWD